MWSVPSHFFFFFVFPAQDRFRALSLPFLLHAHAVVLVCDVKRPETLGELSHRVLRPFVTLSILPQRSHPMSMMLPDVLSESHHQAPQVSLHPLPLTLTPPSPFVTRHDLFQVLWEIWTASATTSRG